MGYNLDQSNKYKPMSLTMTSFLKELKCFSPQHPKWLSRAMEGKTKDILETKTNSIASIKFLLYCSFIVLKQVLQLSQIATLSLLELSRRLKPYLIAAHLCRSFDTTYI